MTGDEVLHHLKADPAMRHIPVIMVSADAMGERIQHLLRLGASGYLTKPYRVSDFVRIIEETLPKKVAVQPQRRGRTAARKSFRDLTSKPGSIPSPGSLSLPFSPTAMPKIAVPFFAAALFFLALAPASRGQEVLDGIAAVVNSEVVTFSQVRELVGPKEKEAHDTLKGKELVEKIKEIRTRRDQ